MGSFREIWIPLADRFYRVAFYMLESEADAEDAVQELYMKLWTGRGRLEDVRSPLAYGIMVLKNICIDRVRRKTASRTEALDESRSPEESPPDRRIALKDTLNHLLAEMERLPENQCKVLKMRVLENLGYEEISRRTGLSEVHIRVLISKARKTLKEKSGYEVDKGY